MQARGRGPSLPYKLLAGVEPCAGGWLVVGGRLQGITITPTEPEVLPTFVDVLDAKPAYTIIALHSWVGLHEDTQDRTCDIEARRVLGWPRAASVVTPPSRRALAARTLDDARNIAPGLNAATWALIRKAREVDAEMQPYWQRTVFEVNPELGFVTLNGDAPMRYSKRSATGQNERRALLEGKLPGIERALDSRLKRVRPWQLLNASANLWTARRIMSRGISRLPEDPEWDERGLRMEITR